MGLGVVPSGAFSYMGGKVSSLFGQISRVDENIALCLNAGVAFVLFYLFICFLVLFADG